MDAQLQTSPSQTAQAVDNYDVNKWNEMTPEEQQRVIELSRQIDIRDSQAVIQYGSLAQSEVSKFSDAILDQIRTKDSGEVGAVLTELLTKVQEVDVDSLDPNKQGFFDRLFGSIKRETGRFMARYEKLSVQIEKIIDQLDRAKLQLIRDIATLDTMYAKNLEYLKELDIYIMAGSLKLKELNDKVLPELKEKAERTGDPVDAQKVKDMAELINRFEKKLHDLKLTRMIAIQTAPQIRLIQNNDQVLVEKIQSSIMNTIPLWKNQIAIAIAMLRQQSALKLQQDVTRTTNELLSKNSEMLKTSSIEIARESERGIVELETLKKVNEDLLTTLEETLKIQQEGRAKRQQAEMELRQMEEDLKKRLLDLRDRV
jgi:Toxic anion resistance protein (TelA).